MYMDDIKLFAKNEKELETLNTHMENIQSGHRDGIWHRIMMKSGRRHMTEGMELPNQEKIRTLEEKNHRYLGTLEVDTTKQAEMKEKTKKEYLRKTRKLLEINLYSRNLIKEINTSAVPLVKYSGPFLKLTKKELKQMDQRTRKLMTMHYIPDMMLTDYMC